jgi:hypothetical protein
MMADQKWFLCRSIPLDLSLQRWANGSLHGERYANDGWYAKHGEHVNHGWHGRHDGNELDEPAIRQPSVSHPSCWAKLAALCRTGIQAQ